MGFTSFFKPPKHRQFNIEPRYWDPAKEAREDRERRIKAELGIKDENGEYIPNIKGRMKSELQHRHLANDRAKRKSNLMLVVIFILLVIIAYLFLYGDSNTFNIIEALLRKQ